MTNYLYISLTRNDGHPDNSALRVAVELNRHGFILEDAYLQGRFPLDGGYFPETVMLAQVSPPEHFRRLLPRLAAKLSCHIVLTCTPDEPPRPRAWHVTPDGIYPFAHDD